MRRRAPEYQPGETGWTDEQALADAAAEVAAQDHEHQLTTTAQEGTTMTSPKPEKYVYDAVRAAGGKMADLTDEQRQRALNAPTAHAGLRGKALGTWIMDGNGLAEQVKDAAATRSLRAVPDPERSVGKGATRVTGTEPPARIPRGNYPEEIHDAAKRAKALRGYGPGPKQHAHMRKVLAGLLDGSIDAHGEDQTALVEGARQELDGGKVTRKALVELAGAKSLAELHAIAAKEQRPGKGLRVLGSAMGDDAWCKGGHLAAHLAAWCDQIQAAR